MLQQRNSLRGKIERGFKDSSLNLKLVLLLSSITGLIVLFTLIFAMIFGSLNMRKDLMESYQTTASIIASNLEAAVMFQDQYDSKEVIDTLEIYDSIHEAHVFTSEGEKLASYIRGKERLSTLKPENIKTNFAWMQFSVNQPIYLGEKQLGTLILYGVSDEYFRYLWTNILFALLMLVFALLLAILMSYSLGKIIIRPIIKLSSTAKVIRENKDYSIRQEKNSNDEVGHLIDSFNGMMDQIEEQNDIIYANALRFKSYFDLGIVGMALLDQELELVEQNRRFLDIFKYKEKELSKDTWNYIIKKSSSDLDQVIEDLKKDKVSEYTGECWFKGKEGTVYVIISIRAIPESKTEPKHFLMLIQDITDRKIYEEALINAKEEAEASNKAKDDFLSVMSHELRTPLNPIMGFSDLIKLETNNPVIAHNADTIYEAANHLLNIITSILDYTKIKKGKMRIQYETFNYVQLCEKAVSQISQKNDKNIEFITRHELRPIDGSEPGQIQVSSDQTKFLQLLYNLLENAYKFTDAGRVCLESLLEIKNTHLAQLTVTIKDTGAGMSEEQIKSIFEPFHQADNSMTREHGGIGLGLAICAKIVHFLEGEIHCTSEHNKGSQFSFSIPVRLPAKNEINSDTTNKSSIQKESNYKILLVEDDPVNQELALVLLQKLGYQADLAENGLEATQLAKANNYKLILMDLQLPKMNGLQATKEIRRLNNGKESIPIIAITAHASIVSEKECKSAGMNDYLSKPFTLQQLEYKLAKYASN